MDLLDYNFNNFVELLNPIDSRIHVLKSGYKEYWVKLTSNKICNWCYVNREDLRLMSIQELVDKYTHIKDEKQKELGM